MNRSSKLVSSFRLDSQKSVYTRSLTSDETGGCHGCSTALTSLPPRAQDRGSASVAKPGEGLLHAVWFICFVPTRVFLTPQI